MYRQCVVIDSLRYMFVCLLVLFSYLGCTAKQQDRLLTKSIEWHRHWVGLVPMKMAVGEFDFSFLQGGVALDKNTFTKVQSNPEVIVMVHGYGSSKDSWNLLSAELIEQYHLIQVDLPGHGGTKAPDEFDFDLEDQAAALKQFIEALGLSRVHLIGNSMGGAVGLLCAWQYPERFKSLILISSAGAYSIDSSPFEEKLSQGENPLIVKDDASFNRMMEWVMYDPPYIPWPYRPAIVRGARSRLEINQKIFDEMLATRERLAQDPGLEFVLSQVAVPTLLLWGKEDKILDVSSVDVFRQFMPYTEYRIFEEVGHAPMAEVPKLTAEEVVQFVQYWK